MTRTKDTRALTPRSTPPPRPLAQRTRAGALGLLLLILAVGGSSAPAHAQERPRLAASDVKAGLIYSFLRYTSWPTTQSGPLAVCVWSRDTLEGRLGPITARTVGPHAIQLRTVTRASELQTCSLLFVGADESAAWSALYASLQGRPILTVSDLPDFAERGGMIEIYTTGARIGIRINRSEIAQGGLSIEDRLARLADASPGPSP